MHALGVLLLMNMFSDGIHSTSILIPGIYAERSLEMAQTHLMI